MLGERVESARESRLGVQTGVEPARQPTPEVDPVKVMQRHLSRIHVVLEK